MAAGSGRSSSPRRQGAAQRQRHGRIAGGGRGAPRSALAGLEPAPRAQRRPAATLAEAAARRTAGAKSGPDRPGAPRCAEAAPPPCRRGRAAPSPGRGGSPVGARAADTRDDRPLPVMAAAAPPRRSSASPARGGEAAESSPAPRSRSATSSGLAREPSRMRRRTSEARRPAASRSPTRRAAGGCAVAGGTAMPRAWRSPRRGQARAPASPAQPRRADRRRPGEAPPEGRGGRPRDLGPPDHRRADTRSGPLDPISKAERRRRAPGDAGERRRAHAQAGVADVRSTLTQGAGRLIARRRAPRSRRPAVHSGPPNVARRAAAAKNGRRPFTLGEFVWRPAHHRHEVHLPDARVDVIGPGDGARRPPRRRQGLMPAEYGTPGRRLRCRNERWSPPFTR